MNPDASPFEYFMYFFKPLWEIFTHEFFLVLYALIIIPPLVRWLLKLRFDARSRKTGVEATDRMDGREFERWLAVKFKQMGFQVELQRGFKDKGADLILHNKHGLKIAVQAKKLGTKRNIGVKVLGEVLRAMKYFNAPKGIVVTNQYFTREMREEAAGYDDVYLWDREKLIKEIERAQQLAARRAAKKAADSTKVGDKTISR